MSDDHFPSTAILYHNTDRTVVLLDLPRSISLAQGTPDNPCTAQIYSAQPLKLPYPSTEPKSEKAKAHVRQSKVSCTPNEKFPKLLLHQALEEISQHWQGDWCWMRKESPVIVTRRWKKQQCSEFRLSTPSPRAQNPYSSTQVPSLASSLDTAERSKRDPTKIEPNLRLSETSPNPKSYSEPLILWANSKSVVTVRSGTQHITNKLVYNPCITSVSLVCAGTKFNIPPNASFMMAKISEAMAPVFTMAALKMLPQPSATAGVGQFDFILLDPPWENRSVRRSAKYDTMRGTDPVGVLKGVLGQHIARNGLVACWITNNSRSRAVALETFTGWDVKLIEEWAWLKTTVLGEPTSEIEGTWRQPYEILLLGKKSEWPEIILDNPKKRVVVAVPDLHSRKPNLKELIEPMMPTQYRALELFGRTLSAGWWAWGDEALRFNWEGHWSKNGCN